MRIVLALISLLVPRHARGRWLEEWRAEVAHARWTMVLGAPADAWAMRKTRTKRAGLLHGLPEDLGYAARSLMKSPAFAVAVMGSLALGVAAIGALVGAGAAATAGVLIRSRLYGASAVDPVAFAAAGLLMILVMSIASWIPARQAGKVDPLQVLRTE